MKLVEPERIEEREFNDFVSEFKASGERLVPYSLDQKDMDFQAYIQALKDESLGKGIPEGWVPASTYFLMDENGRIHGAVNIRHRLTDKLKLEGGHVGYGVRPSARNQGYGTRILKLALDKLREMDVREVLVTCDKKNAASGRVIQKNGGVLDSELEADGRMTQRHWIKL